MSAGRDASPQLDPGSGRPENSGNEAMLLALIGCRGSGKSSVAREIGSITGRAFVDTDEEVMRRADRSIAEIFADEGEAAFRRLEAEVISEVVAKRFGVISVGGGAVLDQQNVERLRSVAMIVYLTATPEELWRRIEVDQATRQARPALTGHSGLEEIRHVLAERSRLYECAADSIVDTMNKSPRQVAEEILELHKTSQPKRPRAPGEPRA
ncbi:MAG: shikimate kinase [Phycisphaerales bacterium]|nr:MAG: shikimate kinase [Phycisphaerales bacterium]